MKKLHTILAVILITATTFAQAPEKMSYQAVVRDASGALVREQLVGIEIEILYSQYGGTAYFETHFVNTNANGLVTLEIGTGGTGNVFNDFSAIQWDTIDGNWIYTKIDPLGGVNYTITNISQLLSVPYALHAKKADNVPSYKIGDFAHGGIVFWVDPTDNNHGLVCSIENLTEDINWSNGTDGYTNEVATGAKALDIGQGSYNTDIIIDILGEPITNYAAGLARSYSGGGYTDWFLPSKDELNQLYVNSAAIGGFTDYYFYWSSTEFDYYSAWEQIFSNGAQYNSDKAYTPNVRAVRAF